MNARNFGVWKCAGCGCEAKATAHQLRKTYCSKSCMAAAYRVRLVGEANPNFRNAGMKDCAHCGIAFKSYCHSSKFCSTKCYASGGQARGRAWRDANHHEIVAEFHRLGAAVLDTTRMGGGFPDLLVKFGGELHLVEVKNPKTLYGRSGFSRLQKQFCDEWKGSPVRIVSSVEEVGHFIAQADYDAQEWR